MTRRRLDRIDEFKPLTMKLDGQPIHYRRQSHGTVQLQSVI